MKVVIKTLKGGRFEVEAELTSTIAEVKATIEASQSDLPADKMKLIHSGRILKDTDSLESCNLKPDDFLVVMVTKVKSKPAATPPPAPAAAPAATEAPASAPAPAPASTSSTTEAPAPSAAPASASGAAAPAPASSAGGNEFPAEIVSNLTGMGFPESMVLPCLRAAQGNPDMAMEFLTNGIPQELSAQSEGGSSSSAASGGGSGSGSGGAASGSDAPLEALRNHPQFDALRRLVQSNPQALQAVLAQIGQQQPELLQEINANQAAFLRMMNEPITEQRSTESSTPGAAPAPSGGTGGGGTGAGAGILPAGWAGALGGAGGAGGLGGAGGGLPLPLMEGLTNPQQVAQMLQSMGPAELQTMAQMMGVTPDQLRASAQMLGAMQPDQLQQLLAMGGAGGLPGLGGMGGGGGPGGGAGGGPQVVRLSEDDVAAVNRLADMGFDRTEATQAYLACDRDEALAANLLMDGGFGFDDADGGGSGGGGGGGGSGGGSGGGGGDDTDQMYD